MLPQPPGIDCSTTLRLPPRPTEIVSHPIGANCSGSRCRTRTWMTTSATLSWRYMVPCLILLNTEVLLGHKNRLLSPRRPHTVCSVVQLFLLRESRVAMCATLSSKIEDSVRKNQVSVAGFLLVPDPTACAFHPPTRPMYVFHWLHWSPSLWCQTEFGRIPMMAVPSIGTPPFARTRTQRYQITQKVS